MVWLPAAGAPVFEHVDQGPLLYAGSSKMANGLVEIPEMPYWLLPSADRLPPAPGRFSMITG